MAFRIGQKVVCIRAFADLRGCETWPVKGQTYTVRGFNDDGYLFLDEIINPPFWFAEGFCEAAWNPEKFRAIVERKTDISIFTAMLSPTKREMAQ